MYAKVKARLNGGIYVSLDAANSNKGFNFGNAKNRIAKTIAWLANI